MLRLLPLQKRVDKCEAFEFGPYRLIPSKRTLLAGQDPVELDGRAFDILALLLRHRGEVVTRRHLLDQVWPGVIMDEATLRVQMSELSRALPAKASSATDTRSKPAMYRF